MGHDRIPGRGKRVNKYICGKISTERAGGMLLELRNFSGECTWTVAVMELKGKTLEFIPFYLLNN